MQGNALSFEWTTWCFWRKDLSLKPMGHLVHLNDFSPMWIDWCLSRSPWLVKDFSHVLHLKGFTPVWILMWTVRPLLCAKLLLHWPQEYGFSPLWILLCILRSRLQVNFLLHRSHSFSGCFFFFGMTSMLDLFAWFLLTERIEMFAKDNLKYWFIIKVKVTLISSWRFLFSLDFWIIRLKFIFHIEIFRHTGLFKNWPFQEVTLQWMDGWFPNEYLSNSGSLTHLHYLTASDAQ